MKCLPLATLALSLSVPFAAHADWAKVEADARGQTVYFNAWGGSEATNTYIGWVAQQVKGRYGVELRHVKVTDAAEVVKRVQTEVAAGRRTDGSVDLIWVNGENFRNLKQGGLLFGPWAESLPNWGSVDLNKPVRSDFSVPTDGYEAPWGAAQLTFIADKAKTPTPPRSAAELLVFAKANPGRVSYPKLPDFHGTTFVKQVLIELAPDRKALQAPVSTASFASATAPLWAYLDQLHPQLWRGGKTFPASAAEMHRMLADGELKLSLTFNPNEAANLISTQQLPATAYSFGFTGGQGIGSFDAQSFGLEFFSNFCANSAQVGFGCLQTHLTERQTLASFNLLSNGDAFARRIKANDVAHANICTQAACSANGTLPRRR